MSTHETAHSAYHYARQSLLVGTPVASQPVGIGDMTTVIQATPLTENRTSLRASTLSTGGLGDTLLAVAKMYPVDEASHPDLMPRLEKRAHPPYKVAF